MSILFVILKEPFRELIAGQGGQSLKKNHHSNYQRKEVVINSSVQHLEDRVHHKNKEPENKMQSLVLALPQLLHVLLG